MQTIANRTLFYASALAATAGFVDAVGFIHTGGYFVSFMSGNTTTAAVRLAQANGLFALSAMIIGLFVFGVVAGTMLARLLPPKARWLQVHGIAALLAAAALLFSIGWNAMGLALLPIAMGAKNTILENRGLPSFGVTYMTGALVKFGQNLAVALTGGPRWDWTRYAILWCGLAAGAFSGAMLYSALGVQGLWIPVAALATLGFLSPT